MSQEHRFDIELTGPGQGIVTLDGVPLDQVRGFILDVTAGEANKLEIFMSPSHSRITGACTASLSALCPDLLRYEQIGEADNLRGRVVRAFFWLMRWWPA